MKIANLRLDENPLQRPPLEVAIRGAKPVFEFLRRVQYALETWDMDLGAFGLRQVRGPPLPCWARSPARALSSSAHCLTPQVSRQQAY